MVCCGLTLFYSLKPEIDWAQVITTYEYISLFSNYIIIFTGILYIVSLFKKL